MSAHRATLHWKLTGPDFARGQYSREHTWTFDGGITVPASPAPSVVPAPWSNAAHVDPEEAYVAAVASCHFLTFLWLASRAGFVCESYEDDAEGVMAKNERGVPWVAAITLRPRLTWRGPAPDATRIAELHERAHEQCFIAQSIRTRVVVATA